MLNFQIRWLGELLVLARKLVSKHSLSGGDRDFCLCCLPGTTQSCLVSHPIMWLPLQQWGTVPLVMCLVGAMEGLGWNLQPILLKIWISGWFPRPNWIPLYLRGFVLLSSSFCLLTEWNFLGCCLFISVRLLRNIRPLVPPRGWAHYLQHSCCLQGRFLVVYRIIKKQTACWN